MSSKRRAGGADLRLLMMIIRTVVVLCAVWWMAACNATPLLSSVQDRVVTAKVGSVTHTVSYDANGAQSGSLPTDFRSYESGETVIVLGNTGLLSLNGCFFAGWNTEADGSGMSVNKGETIRIGRDDVRLFARWMRENKILATDGVDGDQFGSAASIDGNYAVIGAFLHDDNGSDSGSAYIFHRTGTATTPTWDAGTKITASDGAAEDYFGESVAIAGDYVIVGAYGDDDNGSGSGSAHIFHRAGSDTWDTGTKITASDGAALDNFGYSVAISGDYAIVGAYGDDDNGSDSGSAYIFHRTVANTWDTGTKITASDGTAGDHFGISVAISGDYAIVGAYDVITYSGSAYIFHRTGTNTWDTGTKITASDGTAADYFGISVGISGDYVIVGDDYHSDSAYIFHRTGLNSWEEGTTLVPPASASSGAFGSAVQINGEYAVVAAAQDNSNGNGSGAVFLFHRTGANTWDAGIKIVTTGDWAAQAFGYSIGITTDYLVAGARLDSTNGNSAGAAYVIQFHDSSSGGGLPGGGGVDASNVTSVFPVRR